MEEKISAATRGSILKYLLTGIGATVPLAIALSIGAWNLSDKIGSLSAGQANLEKELKRVENYFQIPPSAIPGRTYTDSNDPDISRRVQPSHPQSATLPSDYPRN